MTFFGLLKSGFCAILERDFLNAGEKQEWDKF